MGVEASLDGSACRLCTSTLVARSSAKVLPEGVKLMAEKDRKKQNEV